MAPSQQGVVGGARSMSESDLREDEEEDEEELEERRRRRRGHERVRGRSYEQLDSLTLPLAPRRPPRTYPPPPGQLTRAPSQATMHLTTVPQVGSILIFILSLFNRAFFLYHFRTSPYGTRPHHTFSYTLNIHRTQSQPNTTHSHQMTILISISLSLSSKSHFQSLVARQLGSRHHPTRSSLRWQPSS